MADVYTVAVSTLMRPDGSLREWSGVGWGWGWGGGVQISSVSRVYIPRDPDRVRAVLAVVRRLGEADVRVLVDAALVHKEVLVDLHDGCGK